MKSGAENRVCHAACGHSLTPDLPTLAAQTQTDRMESSDLQETE